VTSTRNEEMKVQAYGDTVVVTGILRVRGNGKEGAFDRRYSIHRRLAVSKIISGESSPLRII